MLKASKREQVFPSLLPMETCKICVLFLSFKVKFVVETLFTLMKWEIIKY